MNQKVLIVGMAKSGISAAKFCHQNGFHVTLFDGLGREKFEKTINELNEYPFQYIFGDMDDDQIREFDLLVMSPGVPLEIPLVEMAKRNGIEIIGEIELAFRHCLSPILAITGTNGKTTTTTLVGEIMRAYNPGTFVVGNIGIPFTDVVNDTTKDGFVIAEISSFQLETIQSFSPRVSAILNITEDHLNRHKTMENYIDMKLRISENQKPEDFCVLNYDDEFLKAIAHRVPAKVLWFSYRQEIEGVFHRNGIILQKENGKEKEILNMSEVKIFGPHNVENIMAAYLISSAAGVPLSLFQTVVKEFKGVAHRIEYVNEIDGVKYYNDSKATNVDSAIKGIQAMKTSTILLGGGMDKKSPFDGWIQAFDGKVKALILYGETKYIIQDTAHRNGFMATYVVEDLVDATRLARRLAKPSDSVLLSPACASWDMFENFEARGDLFKNIVNGFK